METCVEKSESDVPPGEQVCKVKMKSISSFFAPTKSRKAKVCHNAATILLNGPKGERNIQNEIVQNGVEIINCEATNSTAETNESLVQTASNETATVSPSEVDIQNEQVENEEIKNCEPPLTEESAASLDTNKRSNSDIVNDVAIQDESSFTTATEMSYEDFIRSQSNGDSPGGGTHKKAQTSPNECENKASNENATQNNVNVPPKGCRSITGFFSKSLEKSASSKKTVNHLTTKADIHPEPQKKKCSKAFDIFSKQKRKSGLENAEGNDISCKKQNSNVVIQKADMSIDCIETIDLTPEVPDEESETKCEPNDTGTTETNEELCLKTNNKERKPRDAAKSKKCSTNVVGENDGELEVVKVVKPAKQTRNKAQKLLQKAKGVKAQSSDASKLKKGKNCAPVNTESTKKAKKIHQDQLSSQIAALDAVQNKVCSKAAQSTLCFNGKGMAVKNKLASSKNKSPNRRMKNKKGRILKQTENNRIRNRKEKFVQKQDEARVQKTKVVTQVDQLEDDKVFESPKRTRRVLHCDDCEGCAREEDCGKCDFCLDKPKFGGKGTKKQKCRLRQCKQKQARIHEAKKILQKAKSGRLKKMSSPKENFASRKRRTSSETKKEVIQESNECGQTLRRSSRRSAQLALESIAMNAEDDNKAKTTENNSERNENVKTNTREAGSKKLKKKSCVNTKIENLSNESKVSKEVNACSSKSDDVNQKRTSENKANKGKLASIFSKKTPVSTSGSDSEDCVVVETEEDVAKRLERRQFLLSGVPETLKSQKAVSETFVLSDYPPIPTISHIQQAGLQNQISDTMWNLPCIDLPIHPVLHDDVIPTLVCWSTTPRLHTADIPEITYEEPTAFKDETVKLLLAEIATANPAFPVRRVFKNLTSRKTEAEEQNFLIEEFQDLANPLQINQSKKRKLDFDDHTKTVSASKRRCKAGDWGVVVNLDNSDEDTKQDKKELSLSLRRSSRSKSSKKAEKELANKEEETTNEIKEDPVKEVSEEPCKRELVWIDKYAPQNSSEFLGNGKSVERMKMWLKDWKRQTDIEIRRMERELEKEAKRKKKKSATSCGRQPKEESHQKAASEEWWDEDCTDFEQDGDDSESEFTVDEDSECSLCNTLLVSGPSGIGKTAMVYALAQELGYKVFEVNASSKRNGKQVLAQLQEATQSHQVSNKHLDDVFSTILSGKSLNDVPTQKKEQPKPMSAAFNNLFKKGKKGDQSAGDQKKKNKSKEVGDMPKTPKGKRKCDRAEEKTPKGRKKRGNENSKTPMAKPRGKRNRRVSSDDVEIIKEEASPMKKKIKGKASNEVQLTTALVEEKKKGLDLASVSLILFEEIDLMFEEDKGFWAAVQTLMNTTKRPIVLTTTDRHILKKFDPRGDFRVETLSLRTTIMSHISSHLQVLCLAEGIRTDANDMLNFVQYNEGDIRQTINSLQYWAESGGSRKPFAQSIVYNKHVLNKKTDAAQKEEEIQGKATPIISTVKPLTWPNGDSGKDSEEEFDNTHASQRPRNRRRRLIIEDETSCDSAPASPKADRYEQSEHLMDESSQESQPEECPQDVEQDLVSLPFCDGATPLQHKFVFESSTGVMHMCRGQPLLKVIDTGDLLGAAAVVSHFMDCGWDIVHSNLYNLLHLPKVKVSSATYLQHKTACNPTKRSRIKNNSDLFDTHSDSDEDVVESTPVKKTEAQSVESGKSDKKSDVHMHRALQSLTDLYDNMSYIDSFFACVDRSSAEDPRHITSGQMDSLANFDEPSRSNVHSDLASFAALCSVRKSKDELFHARQNAMKDSIPDMTVPVESDLHNFSLHSHTALQHRMEQSYVRTSEAVSDCLNPRNRKERMNDNSSGPAAVVGKSSVVEDYMPVLRTICKSEQARQASKTKRRFLHYFDHIQFGLKQSTLDTLCSSFT